MNDSKMAYSVMLISTFLFLAIGFMDYYPLVIYHQWENPSTKFLYEFLIKFEPLRTKYQNKLLLLMAIVAAVMLYNPKKVSGKSYVKGLLYLVLGVGLLYFCDFMKTTSVQIYWMSTICYFLGFLFSLSGSVHLFQVLSFSNPAKDDPFNEKNESFLQMEEKIDTPHSVNIPYEYRYNGKIRNGWINFVNLFRALLIIGTPGSGKSFALIEEIIEQFINKSFTLLIYDFKFDTLSRIAYNYWLRKKEDLEKNNPELLHLIPEFYTVSFDDPEKSHRNNPINPYLMKSQIDVADAATIIMKNLNREWIKQNDFFSRSAISFVSGLIWYLKKKAEETGTNICTLPHVIILSTVNIEYLLDIILRDMEVRSLMIPFKDALEREASQQLSGQTASAQISLSMLTTKEIFYIMTGNDFQLDINSKSKPKIVCIQNNPDRSEVYSAPIGLIINKTLQVVNKPGGLPMGVILDELPTIFLMGLRKLIDTGRSHLIASVIGIQSISQLIVDYGKELADVLFDNCANVFSGAAKGETARRMSEIFGKIHQEKASKTMSKNDTTTNLSTQMMELMPKSKITSMSTGYFGGIVADTFENTIKQKLCYGLLKPNMASKKIQKKYDTPMVRDFKVANHDQLVHEQLVLLQDLNFYHILVKLDLQQNDYIAFYNTYLDSFSKENFVISNKRMQFVKIVRELKFFDHLNVLEDMIKKDHNATAKIKPFIEKLVDRMFIEKEIKRVLDENFINVLQDIDKLVKNEYYLCKGKYPEFTIFDPEKITDEIETTIDDNKEIAQNFMDDYNKMSTTDLLSKFNMTKEKPTFEESLDQNPEITKSLDNDYLFASEPYSTYQIENLDE